MSGKFQAYSKVIQLYIYIYPILLQILFYDRNNLRDSEARNGMINSVLYKDNSGDFAPGEQKADMNI